jgi:hypothetical protein
MRGWGTWYQGEVTGAYLLFNSNEVVHMLNLSANPSEAVGVGAMLYHFSLQEPNDEGPPVLNRHFTDEIDLYLDWSIGKKVFLYRAYGSALPGMATGETLGDDERFQVLDLSAELTFWPGTTQPSR